MKYFPSSQNLIIHAKFPSMLFIFVLYAAGTKAITFDRLYSLPWFRFIMTWVPYGMGKLKKIWPKVVIIILLQSWLLQENTIKCQHHFLCKFQCGSATLPIFSEILTHNGHSIVCHMIKHDKNWPHHNDTTLHQILHLCMLNFVKLERLCTHDDLKIFRVTGHLRGEFTGPRWIPRTKGQWRRALMFSLICVWINGWVNNREVGDLRHYCAQYDVIVMSVSYPTWKVSAQINLMKDDTESTMSLTH